LTTVERNVEHMGIQLYKQSCSNNQTITVFLTDIDKWLLVIKKIRIQ
jgi:hypothetical protein